MVQTKAKVTVKNGKGEVVATQDYTKLVFEGVSLDDKGKPVAGDASEMLSAAIAHYQAQAGEKGNGVVEMLKDVTYAYDLAVRAKIRTQLERAAEGPEKAIEKQIKDYIATRAAMGKPVTEEKAREKVLAMLASDD